MEVRTLLSIGLLLAAGFHSGAARSEEDLSVTSLPNVAEAVFVGEPFTWSFSIKNSGTAGLTFPAGAVVLQVDFPSSIEIAGEPTVQSCSSACSGILCAVEGQKLLCTADDGGYPMGDFSSATIGLNMSASTTGEIVLPALDGLCRIDPDNVIVEANEDNNDCTGNVGPINAAELPPLYEGHWMQVTMWDDLLRIYDPVENDVVNAAPVHLADQTPIHAINDLVRHPVSNAIYTFHRHYQSNTQALGVLDPMNGITEIGDTATSFHDSAFGDDGTLYAVGRDGMLYTIDLSNGLPTERCDTGYGSASGLHSALAFDTAHGLIQLADGQLIFIDTGQFPVESAEACVADSVPSTSDLRWVWAAEVVDGVLYAARDSDQLLVVGYDGAVAKYVPVTPGYAHGMIPETGPSLAPSDGHCMADFYTIATQNGADSALLFTLDPQNGALSFLRSLWYRNISSLEFDPRSGRLVGTAYSRDLRQSILFEADPCGVEADSSLAIGDIGNIGGLDVGPGRPAYLISDDIFELDLATGILSTLGTPDLASDALAVHGGEAVLERPGDSSNLTAALDFYDLSDIASGPLRNLDLVYGAGLEAGSDRHLTGLEVGPDGKPFYGILARSKRDQNVNKTDQRPNALVRIDRAGQVEAVGYLPASIEHIAGTYRLVFSDGFEGQVD